MSVSWIISWSLCATLCGLLILVVKHLFREHLSAGWHLHIWLVFYLTLLLPPEILRRYSNLYSGIRLYEVWDPVETVNQVTNAAGQGLFPSLVSSVASGAGLPAEALAGQLPKFAGGIAPLEHPLQRTFFLLYLAGVGAMLLWYLSTALRLRLKIKGQPANDALQARVKHTQEQIGLKRQVTVVFSDLNDSPFACGFFRCYLVLPTKYRDEPVDEGILLHELLHIKHKHILLNVWLIVIRCVHFFNPLIWWLCGQIQKDCELRCDEHCLRQLTIMEHEEYAELLLSNACARRNFLPGTSCLSNGQKNILLRVKRIRGYLALSGASSLAAFVLSLLLACYCLAAPLSALAISDIHRGFGFSPEIFDYNVAQAEAYKLSSPLETAYVYGLSLVDYSVVSEWIVMSDQERAERQQRKFERFEWEEDYWSEPENGLSYRVRIGYRELMDQLEAETGETLVDNANSHRGRVTIYNLCQLPDGNYQAIVRYIALSRSQSGKRYVEDHVIEIAYDGRYSVEVKEIRQSLVDPEQLDQLALPYDAALFYTAAGQPVGLSYQYPCHDPKTDWGMESHELPKQVLTELWWYSQDAEQTEADQVDQRHLAETVWGRPLNHFPQSLPVEAEALAKQELILQAQYGVALNAPLPAEGEVAR